MHKLYRGDCTKLLARVPDQSIDAVITDPPYPMVDRTYGKLTEREWDALMDRSVEECRRVLKPKGSAIFVLQANQRRIGECRTTVFEFLCRWSKRWNLVQDFYWWNHATPPLQPCFHGLFRPSVKLLVWLGPRDCHRDQSAVMCDATTSTSVRLGESREKLVRRVSPCGMMRDSRRMNRSVRERGGVTPFNLLPISNTISSGKYHAKGHPAATPYPLCEWLVKYLCPTGGTVLDPFMGSGTVGLASVDLGRSFVGIERDPDYFRFARRRIGDAARALRTA